jgi:DNA-binding beta-propeller fold protein YncE
MKLLLIFFTSLLLPLATSRADQFVTGQPASSVLGQSDFDSRSSLALPNRFSNPEAVAIDPTTGKVFVADSGNHRILRFSGTAALANGSFPEAVIGQPDFLSFSRNQGAGDVCGARTLAFVYQITVDAQGRLWVCDSENDRVLCFLAASFLGNNPPADYVFGQPDFTTNTVGTTIAKMHYPAGIAIGPDDSLWVADASNNRVLRFDEVTLKASGASADGVLGQASFILSAGGTSATRMSAPYSLSMNSDGVLWVADVFNNRVLRFDNAAALANGAAASGVLGQAAFDTFLSGTSASTLNQPYGVLAGPDGTVYVGDWGNLRIMGFRNAATKANGASADFVLGKPDFDSIDAGPTATLLTGPVNLALSSDGDLFVADYGDNRVLRFSPVKSPTTTILTRKAVTLSSSVVVKGTTTGQVTRVRYRVGNSGPIRRAVGTSQWTFRATLKPGKNLITVIAEGPGGTSSPKSVLVIRN